MRSLRLVAALAVLATTALPACAPDVGSQASNHTEKDSFWAPTAHGALQFGTSNPAAFTDAQRFHSWTFTLSDDADVELLTESSTPNLDPVMYLYLEGRGSYLHKNDDHDGGLASRIAETLAAGTYTVLIKASKEFMRGSFAVAGACSGEGCPATDASVCQAEGPMTMPARTDYNQSCEDALYAILSTPAATAPAGCTEAFEARAVAYYKEYWDDLIGWDAIADGREPYVGVTYHPGAGAVVEVDLGGDEDGMDFVFDEGGNLVHFYQHNQSPDWAWFCADAPAAPEPDEDCFRAITYNSEYDQSDVVTGEGEATAGAPATDLPPQVQAAIDSYAEDLDEGAAISFTYDLWNETYQHGAIVGFSSPDKQPMTYTVVGGDYGMFITYVTDEAGTSLWCQEL